MQVFRVIGIVFLIEWFRGILPTVFALPAGVGDVIVGVTTTLLLVASFYKGPIPNKSLIFVIVIGIVDLISALFLGITSSAGPMQLYSHEMPNMVIYYPLGLIPLYLVPYVFIFHLLSIGVILNDSDIDKKKPV